MIIRSKAPLRLGLAGGGTDVAPYSDRYGGAVLNATINLYAYATLIPRNDGKIIIHLINKSRVMNHDASLILDTKNDDSIATAVYNRIVKDFTGHPLSFDLILYVDAPPGTGLGTSSTLLVTVLGAFVEWLSLPLGEYDIARLAWEIERKDLSMDGGKQDQYAATFGGFNYMEFNNGNVIVNPLRIKPMLMDELSHNFILYYTGISRLSSKIISEQSENVKNSSKKPIEAMHRLKEQARLMKEIILKGEFDEIGPALNFGWKYKKDMAKGISNQGIDLIYDTAIKNGASGGKISGAGGGGYLVLYCPGVTKYNMNEALSAYKGRIEPFEFTEKGLETWTVKNS
ncbi:MAG: dehydrogenase [Bacteroidales bacterium]|nr:dehydrogenase [Bacteroidales bacterium]